MRLSYPGVVPMRLSTRNNIIKSTVVEIAGPCLLKDIREKDDRMAKNHEGSGKEVVPAQKTVQENREAEKIAKATALAEQIIAEAKRQAERILLEAQNENEARRQEFLAQLKKEIMTEAHAEGYNQGLEEAKLETDKILKQAKAYLEMARSVFRDELKKAEKDLLVLCLKICEQILHTSLNISPEKLLPLIRKLALMPQDKEEIKIHISAQDWEWFKTIPDEDKPPYTVIVDESLKMGDVFLECEEGVFDASLKSQLEKIGDYLMEELQHARLDSSGPQN